MCAKHYLCMPKSYRIEKHNQEILKKFKGAIQAKHLYGDADAASICLSNSSSILQSRMNKTLKCLNSFT